ncbi:MAG TPA: phosphate ABC transporter substrate-binding protein [Gemmatales bacterium]|nr:phosphate ABC transporter substrate-binding protein [Gemmatales bacterium]
MIANKFGILALILILNATQAVQAQIQLDPALPPYSKSASGVSGAIKSIGSDSMNNLMALWAEGFKKNYPNIRMEIEGKGSATAPAALIAGTAQFGPMSRPMKDKEIDEFKRKFGYAPTGLPTCIDVLAVYVHKDNPLESLTFEQLDAIFSKTRKRGNARDLSNWGDLGLTGEWANKPISIYGRNAASGTYGYFKEHALANGDFKDTVKEQPGSSAVVQAIANDKYAIGYSGIGYKTADVRALPISARKGIDPVEATAEFALDGTYPLARIMFVYINKNPVAPLDPLRAEFVKYVLSRQGQEVVIQDGYIPLPNEIAKAALELAGIK